MIATLSFTLDPQSILVWALVGLVAGFLASKLITGHGKGLIGDIVVGIIGALIGGFLAGATGITLSVPNQPIISEIIVAFLGAVILLVIFRIVGAGGRGRAFR
jgi:uncharacterized membrane protein YeaQ/YmgE (transglycosylase-associated protein family)